MDRNKRQECLKFYAKELEDLLTNLKSFSTIANKMKEHVKNWVKKLKQGSRINVLQTVYCL